MDTQNSSSHNADKKQMKSPKRTNKSIKRDRKSMNRKWKYIEMPLGKKRKVLAVVVDGRHIPKHQTQTSKAHPSIQPLTEKTRSESHSTHVLVSKPEPTIHWWIISSDNGTLVVLVDGWTEYKTRDLVIMKHYLLIPLFTSVKCWENKMLGKNSQSKFKGKIFHCRRIRGRVRETGSLRDRGSGWGWRSSGLRKRGDEEGLAVAVIMLLISLSVCLLLLLLLLLSSSVVVHYWYLYHHYHYYDFFIIVIFISNDMVFILIYWSCNNNDDNNNVITNNYLWSAW